MLQSTDKSGEAALFNARQGYQQAVAKDIPFSFAQTEYLKWESEQLQLKKQTLDALNNKEFRMFIQPPPYLLPLLQLATYFFENIKIKFCNGSFGFHQINIAAGK